MSRFGFQRTTGFRACLFAAPLLLAACASQPEAVEETADAQSSTPSTDRAAVAGVADRTAGQNRADPADSLLSQLVIHFDFDDSNVGPNYQELLVAHGQYLAEHDDASLRLEGHADERGTREYNIGLGERRASTVRQLLLLQGARDDQIDVLSYGEERPVIAGSSERSWQQNRRVEFVYLSD